ncbi:uncharacterized protein [Onthophagus taurus]|uniref:uncharacterized protein n=1 Tax=Onthophagus taurus TaxID=166361 RepID=UPI000C206F73|nr:uncharacterized protein LOC111424628 [Onthophagus taurus]
MLPYFFYRPFKKRTVVGKICALPWFQSTESYVVALGLLGVILSAIDLLRVLKAGRTLPCVLWRARLRTGSVVTPEMERDLKLLTLILSLEFYGLLIIGMTWKNYEYFLPLLYYYGIVIVSEFAVLFLKMYSVGFELRKHQLLNSMFVVYNWIVVYCVYQHDFDCANC